ncbi:MAG: hypothetical protein K9K62_04285 [Desulfobacteraceae bacterium]|nr:hypothetical protein [Desulfobacteraceae bacterium]
MEVEYNCYHRDFDRVVMVLYYKDGLDKWHIADPSDNGAYPEEEGKLNSEKVENVPTGNSNYNNEGTLVLTASCDFPMVEPGNPETEIVKVKTLVYRLKPGQEKVSEKPDAHFEMP